MNLLDVVLALSGLAAFVGGYRTGLLARVASWAGLLLGLLLAARNMDWLLGKVDQNAGHRRFATIAGILALSAFVGKTVGLLFGKWVQYRLPGYPLRRLNRLAGGGLGLFGVATTAWLAVPLMAQVPGWPAEMSRSSVLARTVSGSFPPAPNAVSSVRFLVEGANFPQVVSGFRESIDVGDMIPFPEVSTEERGDAVAFTAKVTAIACGVVTVASGFSVGNGQLITNAHVVAGAQPGAISVQDASGNSHAASIVAVDVRRDLALLDVDGYNVPALPIASTLDGDEVSVAGFAAEESLRVVAGQIHDRLTAVGRDIYDKRPTSRSVLVLAAELDEGDSGAPVLTAAGKLAGIVFAIAPDQPKTAFALQPSELADFLEAVRNDADSVSPRTRCLGR